jgi:hypothetical protein
MGDGWDRDTRSAIPAQDARLFLKEVGNTPLPLGLRSKQAGAPDAESPASSHTASVSVIARA